MSGETDIVRSILEYLWYRKIFCWRNNSGALKTDRGHFVRFGEPGSPDIIAVVNGHLYGIEVKSAKGKQNENQKSFQKKLEEAGGTYILARGIDDVDARIPVHNRS